MRQLVVLVGLPGTGKTSFQREHPEWAVVSRSAIRQCVFRCSYDPSHETTVDKIFHATLVEVVDSSIDVVCIDEPNLTKSEREDFVELARLSGRQPVAKVMPMVSADALFERMERNLRRLALEKPHLQIRSFPRRSYEALVTCYEPVEENEGFAVISHEETPSSVVGPLSETRRRVHQPTVPRTPLPLFTSP